MGKELVISSNRHEIKVAILEDDQLVEIYFQRANEYSLAGSIHKGRVTRVLPGMQSAFVDVGLDRDAFLYVSDFFEENEEYDKMAGPVEERSRRGSRNEPKPAEAQPASKAEAPSTAEPESKDRRGRRSRRRRGRSKGFPESKYASQSASGWSREEERPPEAPAAVSPAEQEGDDFMVLPGESLAKYRHGDQPGPDLADSAQESASEEQRTPDFEEPAAVAEEADTVNAEEEAVIWAVAGDTIPEPSESEDTVRIPALALAEEEPGEEETEERFSEGIGDEPAAVASLAAEETETGEEGPESVAEAQAEETAEAASEENGESAPAEEPQAATEMRAGVRERGSRYPHRVSRRLRRKMRGGQAEARGEEVKESEAETPRVQTEEKTAPASEKASPSIADLLKEGQEVLVQIAKEPLGQKGARITSHIALPGRYCVYMPTVEHLGVSRKIASDEERARLKRILQTHRTGMSGGFIVRTAGSGRSEKDIAADMLFLHNLWLDIRQKAERRKAPALIHHDLDLVQRLLRDQLTEGFKAVWVDNEEVYERVLQFVERMQPAMVGRVKMYTRPLPIFDAFNITAELEKALRPKVWLKSGGYIVVNQTEALVAIDINTGKFVGKSARLEDTIVKTNTEAIKEIVRQIRLRDLGGIIVIDFIDMDERKNRQKVMQALEDEMRLDRAPYKILQFNDFGLVAITRKRVKQSLERALCAPCPSCEGSGYVKSVQTVIGEILQEAGKLAGVVEGTNLCLRVHPDVAKVLKATDNDYLEELEEILRRPVLVTGDPELHPEKFDLA